MKHADVRLVVSLLVMLASLAGCDTGTSITDSNTITTEPPVFRSISPNQGAYGDTIVVSGSGFGSHPAMNAIVFSPDRYSVPVARRVIIPFGGSGNELRAIVPDGAFTGSVRIERMDPPAKAFGFMAEPPASASSALPFGVRLAAGRVGKSFFSGVEYDFSITAGASDEEYLVIVFSDETPPPINSNLYTYLYGVTTQSSTMRAADRSRSSTGASAPRAASAAKRDTERLDLFTGAAGARRRDFERRINEGVRDLLAKRAGTPRQSVALPAVRSAAAPQATFQVLNNPYASGAELFDPANFTTVTANLKYDGEHALLYVDAETPESCLSDAEAAALGLEFNANIYGTDRSSFGSESDINRDGKVVILMSPVVNRMTPPGSATGPQGYIAGFFLMTDLLPGLILDSRVTNGMEIFYTMVPDPDDPPEFGNVFPKEKTLEVIEGVLAHEFLHMILFNYRVLIYGGGVSADYMEELWINEGLAHIAEDLNGHDASNIGRVKLFLANPGDVTLIYGGDELDERGAEFLFLRHLGDRFGSRIFRDLVQSRKTGVANVEAAAAGYFNELFADWASACFLDGTGITSDVRFNFSSLDLQSADFDPILTITGDISGTVMGYVKAMAPEYILYSIPAGVTVDFKVEAQGTTGRMNAIVVRTH